MCGIFGFIFPPEKAPPVHESKALLKNLFRYSESRGREAAGLAFLLPDKITIHKDACAASVMISTAEYKKFEKICFEKIFPANNINQHLFSVIGHSRLVTNGMQGIMANNQPIARDSVVLIHNGIIVNVDDIVREFSLPQLKSEVDSEAIALLITHFLKQGFSLERALQSVYQKISGEASIALFQADHDALVLATNTGSLYQSELNGGIVFASEEFILKKCIQALNFKSFTASDCSQILPGEARLIGLDCFHQHILPLKCPDDIPERIQAGPSIAPRLGTMRRIEDQADKIFTLLKGIKRCSRCLLPETMPFIRFDKNGVCNYCHGYQKQKLKPVSELKDNLSKYHRHDGKADCLVAFSGGRDSSYGLHLLKKEFGMNPIAFTYDWGMVTDIARRNQARICGQLGIEHLWVSADIKKKRANIKRNLLAWLKRPELGMIPLLMAGDKHFFWLANRTMKNINIALAVWCMNNLERTDFKTGFAGIPPVWDSRRHYHLSLWRTAKIAWYYQKQYVCNPAYLNRSLFDSLTAFISYYLVKQNYIYIFDYLPWEEEKIDSLLIDDYNWEIAPDSKNTWRIGDGTAPFYNYVYMTVAGFSEHDTFRSNQIREGQLSREKGLALVERDNQPRWDSIRGYLQMLNVDFDDVIRVIERIPKLYDK